MTTLEKLGILGIRSFSPEHLEILTFEKPLTLIVGHNGAGKTTIVECLRMSTTGELPPNAGKGQHFVHNAKQHGAPDIKGQIRLVFMMRNGKRALANRNFQLTTTKDRAGRQKISFKALESVVQIKDTDGVTHSINKKCVEMDQQIPLLMGVTKSILDNVIFCHQEESNWPLMDMAKLKKKFDELFGATRYSKVLETISAVRKEHQRIGREKLHALELLQNQLNQSQKLIETLNNAEEKQSALQQERNKIEMELEEKNNLLADLVQRQQQFADEELELRVQKQQLSKLNLTLERTKTELGPRLCPDPEEELLAVMSEVTSQIEELERTATLSAETIDSKETDLERLRRKRLQAQEQATEAVRAEERVLTAVQQRDAMLHRLKEEFNISGEPSPNDLDAFFEQAKNQKNILLQPMRVQADLDFQSAQNSHKIASDGLANLTSNIEVQEQLLRDARRKIAELQQYHEENQFLENAVHETNAALKKLQGEIPYDANKVIADLEHQLNELREKRMGAMQSLRDATTTMANAQKSAAPRALLIVKEQALQNAIADIEQQIKAISTSYSAATGLTLDATTKPNSTAVSNYFSGRLKHKGEKTKELELLRESHTLLVGECGALTTNIDNITAEERKLDATLKNVFTDVTNYEACLAEQRETVNAATRELLISKNASTLFNNFLDHSIQKKRCALCTRPFSAESEIESMKKGLANKLAKLPISIERNEDRLATEREKLQVMEQTAPNASRFIHIQSEMEILQKRRSELQSRLKILQHRLKDTERQSALANEACDKADHLKTACEHLLKRMDELDELRHSIKNLRAELTDESNGPDQTNKVAEAGSRIPRLEELLRQLDEKIRKSELQLQETRKSVECRAIRVLELKNESRELREKVRFAEQHSKDFAAQKKIENDLQSSLPLLRDSHERLAMELQRTSKEMEEAYGEKIAAEAKVNNFDSNLSSIAKGLREVYQKLETAERERKLAATMTQYMYDLDSEVSQLVVEIQKQRNLLLDVRSSISESQSLLDELKASLEVRRMEAEFQALQELIAEKTNQIGDHEQLGLDIAAARSLVTHLTAESAKLDGQKKSNEEWIAGHKKELEKLTSVPTKYREMLIETETELMLIRDLVRYHTALDKALMKYHTLKMNEINRTIRRLWTTVYRGKDIDYIQIRSDTEEDRQNTVVGQRSYNYRVTMMLRDGTEELEMRGRCSSGQKILAAVVIRLAIAESFCSDCGIMALDEPTTNLDYANMEALASALSNLIEERRSCTHFQLILITHDEEFARMISRRQSSDYYFLVKKDENGYSTIRRADMRNF